MPRVLKNSTWPGRMPTTHRMSAVPNAEDHQSRPARFARWAAEQEASPSPTSWLFGGASQHSSELAELRERLAAAERRAVDAEEALPHLLALGQRTVNGLLSDARARGREIIEDARQAASREIEHERRALARESAELDALRMAVAAEAMGLEQIRKELEGTIAAKQLASGPAPGLPLEVTGPAVPVVVDPRAGLLPPPPSPADLDSVGMGNGAETPKDSPSGRFADAWAAGEDAMMSEAFDRFFAAEISRDPLRDAAVDPDAPSH